MAARDKLKKKREKELDDEQQVTQEAGEDSEKQSARSKVLHQSEKRAKSQKLHFKRTRMWIHYILSSMQKDRGKIPTNIGNRMMITNNMYITRYYMSSVIHVETMGLLTPITFQSELVRFLRREGCHAVIDVTMKNMPFDAKLEDAGLRSRIKLWKQTSQFENASEHEKEIAARCLYTVDMAQSGESLFKTRMFITVRAKTGTELTAAEKAVYTYLNKIHAERNQITANLREVLSLMSIIADKKSQDLKDMKALITSEQVLAELLPNSGSLNSKIGPYIGINVRNGTQFKIDWKDITYARNIYICSPSGKGKTVLAQNICASAAEDGYSVCIQDIKGNEFNNFIKSTGGYIVSLRQNSAGYINSWQMHKEDVLDENASMYFMQRLAFSKEQILILSGIEDYEARNDLEELIDSFHEALYAELGVLASNRNTWKNTLQLTPFSVYEKLRDYLTPEVISKYPAVSKKVMGSLRMYMSKGGSKSYIFTGEFDYAAVLRSNTVMFDFGLLEGSSELKDPVVFRLKFAYMQKLNAEYIAYKFKHGIKVLKVLEESQIVADLPDIMKGYVEEFTLRRAQGQTTLMLGNSVSIMLDSKNGKPIIENVTGLFLGGLEEGAAEIAIQRFGLEAYRSWIEELNADERYRNAFLFVNRMQPHAAIPIVKVIWDKSKDYKLFKAVAQSNSGII